MEQISNREEKDMLKNVLISFSTQAVTEEGLWKNGEEENDVEVAMQYLSLDLTSAKFTDA